MADQPKQLLFLGDRWLALSSGLSQHCECGISALSSQRLQLMGLEKLLDLLDLDMLKKKIWSGYLNSWAQ